MQKCSCVTKKTFLKAKIIPSFKKYFSNIPNVFFTKFDIVDAKKLMSILSCGERGLGRDLNFFYRKLKKSIFWSLISYFDSRTSKYTGSL